MTTSSPPSILRLASRQLWRDLRAGELRLLLLAVTLAVAALSAVALFADRLQGGLARDAGALLGGDALIASDHPLPDRFVQTAREMGLAVAQTTTFPSMARADDAQGGQARLVAVKAVSDSYPLRGALRVITEANNAAATDLRQGPAAGEAWADATLLTALQLKLGDSLLLGDARLRLTAIIETEPDRGAGFMNFSPRVMLSASDLPATGLIQPASRATWRIAVAGRGGRGADTAVQGFVAWAEQTFKAEKIRGARIETLENGRPEMRQTLARADQFLRLVAILAAVLCAVAVAIAARGFALRHLDTCAMLRVLGLPQRRIAAIYVTEFVLVGLAASVLGLVLGGIVQQAFVVLLAGLVNTQLPAPGFGPVILGLGVGASLLAAFGLPPVLQLASVPPLRVLRRDLGEPGAASATVLVAGVLGFAGLIYLAAADRWIGSIAVAGFTAAWALFSGVAWLSVLALRRSVPELSAPRWLLLATRQLGARPGLAVLQVSALALGLTALGVLVLLRTDLVDSWRAATPPDAPNRFAVNIQPDQVAPLQASLAQAGIRGYDWYPMMRGRLVAVNGKEITGDHYPEPRARSMVEREFNLSHSATLPQANQLQSGSWQAEEDDAISVEDGLAATLGLKLGDRLRFDIAGTSVEGRITSLRKVDWASMRVNFFVIFPRSSFPDVPLSYISAFRAPAQSDVDRVLSRDFPNLTVVDISAQVAQVQRVLNQVIGAVEFLFAFTLAAGVLVLFSTLGMTRGAREREFALMRAMGASRRLLGQVQTAELVGLGTLAGLLASLAALAMGWALARFGFGFTWHPPLLAPMIGGVIGALLALAGGWWSLRGVVQRPVAQTLRRGTAE